MDTVGWLLDQITATLPENRTALRKLKTGIAAGKDRGLIGNDQLLQRYRAEVAAGQRPADTRVERILTLNSIRSQSGIATVTVITEPYPCPGRCTYCPTEDRAPKSYLTNEPAVMRALRSDYDPYGQVRSRLDALTETGHATDKIELLIKGGTWSFYPEGYQETFIRRCFDACNRTDSATLAEAQQHNETAPHRLIGITIETRPDYVTEAELRRLRTLGITRVELGVQTLEDRVLDLIVRDHGTDAVREATRLLKDAGFKVCYHLMPNLPGATPASDLESMRQLFADPAYQPDTMKLYPCVVIKTAEIYAWWQDGRCQPYDDETLVELLAGMKQLVPPYVRLERVIRDIPSTSIQAGCLSTNLRETVLARMQARGKSCRCIRCRQVREAVSTEGFEFVRREYEASGSREIFLSVENARTDRLASLLRLRLPAARPALDWPVLRGAALIRELHSYGQHVPLDERRAGAVQHQGFGQRLLLEAERLAREAGCLRIAVISGVGVRAYYRRFGYQLEDTYMVKALVQQKQDQKQGQPLNYLVAVPVLSKQV